MHSISLLIFTLPLLTLVLSANTNSFNELTKNMRDKKPANRPHLKGLGYNLPTETFGDVKRMSALQKVTNER